MMINHYQFTTALSSLLASLSQFAQFTLLFLLVLSGTVGPAQSQGGSSQQKPALLLSLQAPAPVSCVRLSPDNKIVAGAASNKVLLWDLEGNVLHTLRGHTGEVLGIAFSADGKLLASSSMGTDSSIKLWNIETGELRHTLTAHRGSIRSVVFSPDGKTLVSGGDDKTLILWAVESGQVLQTVQEHATPVQVTAFDRDSLSVISLGAPVYGGNAHPVEYLLWHPENGALQKTQIPDKTIQGPLALSPNKQWAAGTTNGRWQLRIWRLLNGEVFQSSISLKQNILSLAFVPNSSLVALGGENSVMLWDTDKKRVATSVSYRAKTLALSFSSDGRLMLTGGADNTVRLWRIP